MPRARRARVKKVRNAVKSMMTKLSVAMMAAAGVLVFAPVAHAQETVKAKVPFAFVVNGVELPAGDYVFSRDANRPDLVEVSTAAGERMALMLTRPAEPAKKAAEQPSVEFERIGRQAFLTQITLGPHSSREILEPPAAEDETPKR